MKYLKMLIDKLLSLIGATVGIVATKLSDSRSGSRRNFATNVEIHRDQDLVQIEKIVLEVMKDASHYWSNYGDDEEIRRLGISIRARLSFLSTLITDFFEHHPNELRIATESTFEFYESCTGSLFLVEDREPILDRIQEIEQNAYQLVLSTRSLRRNMPHERVKKWRI